MTSTFSIARVLSYDSSRAISRRGPAPTAHCGIGANREWRYVSFGAGINVMQAEEVDARLVASPSTHFTGELLTDSGLDVGGAFGWAFAKGFRLEVEGNYRSNPITAVGPVLASEGGPTAEDLASGSENRASARSM